MVVLPDKHGYPPSISLCSVAATLTPKLFNRFNGFSVE